jgi:hypothetical protein
MPANVRLVLEDPKDKKHYKLRAPHLERLIDHVDSGGSLDGHDGVLGDIRRDLALEIQTGRESKKADALTSGLQSYSKSVLTPISLFISGGPHLERTSPYYDNLSADFTFVYVSLISYRKLQ